MSSNQNFSPLGAGGASDASRPLSAGGPLSGQAWGIGLLPPDDPARRGSRHPLPGFKAPAGYPARGAAAPGGLWARLFGLPVAPAPAPPVAKGAIWTVGVEWQAAGSDRPPVLVAQIQARTPSSNLLVLTQLAEGAAALLAGRGFARPGGRLSVLPVLEVRGAPPLTPPDWTSHKLELWFEKFVDEPGSK